MGHFERDKMLIILYGMVHNSMQKEMHHAEFPSEPHKSNFDRT